MPKIETPIIKAPNANMSPGKADPTGHDLEHVSHLNGVGHNHDSTGYANGLGHAKFHEPDDHDADDEPPVEEPSVTSTDEVASEDPDLPPTEVVGLEVDEVIELLFNQPPLSEDFPMEVDDSELEMEFGTS